MSEDPLGPEERERLEKQFQSGLRALEEGRAADAVEVFESIVRGGFSNATLMGTYGNALRLAERPQEAVRACLRAVEDEPEVVGWRVNLGAAELACGRWEKAVGIYQSALKIWPESADLFFNLGTALLSGDRWMDAVEAFEASLRLDSDFVKAWENLGAARKLVGDMSGYLAAYRKAAETDPDDPEASWNFGVALLHHAQWLEGWERFESRLRVENMTRREWDVPRWDGRFEPGASLLVHAEQGFGDTFQFMRFLPQIKERVREVAFVVQRPLVPLLTGLDGCDVVVGSVDEVERYDFHLPLLSTPRMLGQVFEEARDCGPYLRVAGGRDQTWAKTIDELEGFKVGFGWRGNASYREDYLRSMSVESFAPILSVPGVSFLSLQKGADAELASLTSMSLTLLGDGLDSREAFCDTAALASALDLVITTDTALAHLAGAIGAPVWLLLPAVADWRWGIEGATTAWYDTMRIFRQSTLGDWSDVVEAVCEALSELSSQQARELG